MKSCLPAITLCNMISFQVISKLTDEKATHIPYRDSKLTRLLQSSLSGHGRISVCQCSYSVQLYTYAKFSVNAHCHACYVDPLLAHLHCDPCL